MPKYTIDITGQKFHRLTAIRQLGVVVGQGYNWEFLCDCGAKCIRLGSHVKAGQVKSCGCLKRLSAQANVDAGKHPHSAVLVEYDGRTLNLRQWSAELGIPYGTLKKRHQRGWEPERMLEQDVQPRTYED